MQETSLQAEGVPLYKEICLDHCLLTSKTTQCDGVLHAPVPCGTLEGKDLLGLQTLCEDFRYLQLLLNPSMALAPDNNCPHHSPDGAQAR